MAKSQIGAQLFTLRDFVQTAADFAQTLSKLKKIGYEAVQLSAVGPIPPAEIKKMLDGEGFVAASTHKDFNDFEKKMPAMIEEHEILGCKNPAIGGLPGGGFDTEATYHNFAPRANKVARQLKDAGFTFSYHNHDVELEKFGSTTGLEILLNETDPEVFSFEIDTYWIQHGGGDPAAWIRRCGTNRPMPVVHFKDMMVHKNQPTMSPVGEGNLNWPNIIDACREVGVEWYLVEQDSCIGDPFESMAASFRNLKALGLE